MNSKLLKNKYGKKCQLSGKKAQVGWNYSFLRSHFNPTSKRRFEVNLQKISTFDENGQPIKIRVATSVLKRCPSIKCNIKEYTKRFKEKRLKGAKKRELLKSLEN